MLRYIQIFKCPWFLSLRKNPSKNIIKRYIETHIITHNTHVTGKYWNNYSASTSRVSSIVRPVGSWNLTPAINDGRLYMVCECRMWYPVLLQIDDRMAKFLVNAMTFAFAFVFTPIGIAGHFNYLEFLFYGHKLIMCWDTVWMCCLNFV